LALKENEMPIKVLVSGAAGRMGREVIKAVAADPELRLVGAVDRVFTGQDAGTVAGIGDLNVPLVDDLEWALPASEAEVAVDFSTPHSVRENIRVMLAAKVSPVIGTTGLVDKDLQEIDAMAREAGVPVFIAPNFAIGAVLMMQFAAQCAKHFDYAEIIEFHHEKKIDAPSGTAFKTAQVMRAARDADFIRVGGDDEASGSAAVGARGGGMGGVSIHSVRAPGYFAHQEVICGSEGQTLTIRHDTITRACYMPGVLHAVKKVRGLEGLTYGLEHIL
jgi:4-hydroxy-tetrahydrodipicolinate reductase